MKYAATMVVKSTVDVVTTARHRVGVEYFVMVQTIVNVSMPMVIPIRRSSVNRMAIFVSVNLYPHVIHHAPAIVSNVRFSRSVPSV